MTRNCTDSEVYFRFLIQNIEEQNGDVIEGIRFGIQKIYDYIDHGSLNFLLSDGNYLYAYRNGNTLFMLKRFREGTNDQNEFEAVSNETKLLLKSKALNHEKAFVICSEIISDEPGWEKNREWAITCY